MAEFKIIPQKVDSVAQQLVSTRGDLDRIYMVFKEGYQSARASWSSNTADAVFGEMAKLLNHYEQVQSFVSHMGMTLQNATGNYITNEEHEKQITDAIFGAFI